VKDGDMVVVRTSNGAFPAEIEQTLEDDTILIYFWNGPNGAFKVKSTIYPAYLEPFAKLKEVYTYSPNAEQSMRPIWNITPMTKVIGQVFMPESKGGEQYLPLATQRQAR
jgi:hypothetical protein